MQLKFLLTAMSARIKKKLIVLLHISFLIFSYNQCYAVAVGDSYGGGTIFCVSQTVDTSQCVTEGSGDYGLIMANVDQANFDSPNYGVTWSSEHKITNAQSDDDGAANTAIIIAAHPNDNGSNNAAWLCHNYDKEKGKIGFTAWYLPSKNELNKMYLYAKANNLIGRECTGKKDNGVRCLVGGWNQYMYYWSSTEYSGNNSDLNAWLQLFIDALQYHHNKINHRVGVRAVRAFNNSTIQQFIDEMRTTLYNVFDTMPMDLINIITNYATEIPSREMLRNTECLTKKGAN